MSFGRLKKQQTIDLMPLLAMRRFSQKPKRKIGLWAVLVVSNVLWISVACLLWGTTWASTKMSVWATEFYAKEHNKWLRVQTEERNRWAQMQTEERAKWEQLQNEKDQQLQNLNSQIAGLVGLQTSNSQIDPIDVLQLAQKISSVLDTASGDQRKFLERALPHAIRLQVQYGIPASVTIAQAAYESSWGKSKLAQEGNNFFGIKAFGDWKGDRLNMDTKDRGIPTRADFRAYKTLAAGFQGYADFLRENVRYNAAFYSQTGEGFLSRILAAGYCPDPTYASDVKSIITRYNLSTLDSILKQANSGPYQLVLLNKKNDDDKSSPPTDTAN